MTTRPIAYLTILDRGRMTSYRLCDAAGRLLWATRAYTVNQEHIPPQGLSRWTAVRAAYVETLDQAKHEHRPRRRLAYLWLLDALLAEPDALVAAVQAARDELVATDEALQPFAE